LFAAEKGLGFLINRPLNAFAAGRLFRLADLPAEEAARELSRIRSAVDNADAQWANQGTLSQKAIRALRSTAGVSVVLVGMRDSAYVEDVLTELRQPITQKDRQGSWAKLRQGLADLFPACD